MRAECEFIEPDAIAEDPELHRVWLETIQTCQRAYRTLADGLAAKFSHLDDKTLRRKKAREAARSVLPNATETKIFVTANARALRHFIESAPTPPPTPRSARSPWRSSSSSRSRVPTFSATIR